MEVSIFHLFVGTKKSTKKVNQNQFSCMSIIFENMLWLGFVINTANGTTYWFKTGHTGILEHQTN